MGYLSAVQSYLSLSPPGMTLLGEGLRGVRFERPTAVIHKGQRVSGAGETCVLALNCLFNDLRYPAWVESDVDTEVVIIPGPIYRRLFEREPAVQDLTVKTLSTLVFRLMGEIEQIHACTLDQRLAGFILGNASADGVLPMTQQALAGHLGTSREVVARLMQGFTARGLVKTGRGMITLIDAAGLAEVARPG